MDELKHYMFRVTWSNDDDEYVGLCAEFPSLSWLAPSPEQALTGIRQVINDVIRDLAANNEPIPSPLFSQSYSGKFVVRVPPELHRKLALEAAEAGISLNRIANLKLSN